MLTEKQKRFCQEYVVDDNATQAAIRAKYSPRSARHWASRFLNRADAQEYIGLLRRERQRRTGITADRVLREFARIGFFDIRKAAKWDAEGVRFIPSADIDGNTARAITSVKSRRRTFTSLTGTTETVDLELKMADKLEALDKLARHLGLYEDNDESDGDEEAERLAEMFKAMVSATRGSHPPPGADPMGVEPGEA